MILYDVFLLLYFLLSLPKLFGKKKPSHLLQRLGIKPYDLPLFSDQNLIWVHAVSVGETKAAKRIIQQLRESYPSATILVSTTTKTGQEEARRSLKEADYFIYFPFDFSWAVKRLLKQIKPKIVIFVESEFWYHFLTYAKKMLIRTVLISGKISSKSATLFSLFLFFSRRLFSQFDCLGLQNETHKDRFLKAHAPQEKIQITGNLKFANAPLQFDEDQINTWRTKLGDTNTIFLTIASTHPKEEVLLLKTLQPLLERYDHLKILLAPRHPERCPSLFKELLEKGFSISLLSNLKKETTIILIDRLGLVEMCYHLSVLAVIGGSFVKEIGGHNILESILQKTPVIFGPYMFAQEEMRKLILQNNCGMQVGLSSLKDTIDTLLSISANRSVLEKNCDRVLHMTQKSFDRNWTALLQYL